MQEQYWTEEHIEKYEENLKQAENITMILEQIQSEHDKGGVFYNATKKLLEAYRSLRFDVINEKMLRLAESAEELDGNGPDSAVTLENILSMPDIYAYYSKEIKGFMKSSTPVAMGLFVHIIDAGIKALDYFEKLNGTTEFSYGSLLRALYIDAEKTPQELFEQFDTNRSTFYRKKDEAITALSVIVFGPLGGRHPSSIFDDSQFCRKYGRFFEIADGLDIMSGCIDVSETAA